MKKLDLKSIKELAFFSSVGLSLSLSIFIGLALGVYLDRRVFHTTPWLTLIGLGFGIAAGYRNLLFIIKRSRKL